jgi:hypothetical protein
MNSEELLLKIQDSQQRDGLWDLYFFEKGLVVVKVARLNAALVGALTGVLGNYIFFKKAQKKAATKREKFVMSFSFLNGLPEEKIVVNGMANISLKKGFMGNKLALVDKSGVKKTFYLSKSDYLKIQDFLRSKSLSV